MSFPFIYSIFFSFCHAYIFVLIVFILEIYQSVFNFEWSNIYSQGACLESGVWIQSPVEPSFNVPGEDTSLLKCLSPLRYCQKSLIQSSLCLGGGGGGGGGGEGGEEICDDPKVYKSLICLKMEVIVQFKNSSSS